MNAVLLRPLPFPEPERLVKVQQIWEGQPTVYSPQNFLDVEAQSRSFDSLAAIDTGGITLTGAGAPARIEAAFVSVASFDLLRVRPMLGRVFVAGENESGRHRVAVLGDGLWRDRFAGDPAVVGRTIQLARQPHVVVGVAPAGFSYPEGVDVWVPIEYDAVFRTKSRGAWYLNVVGRLRPGVTVEGARQEVATIADRLARAYPDHDRA